MYSFSSKLYILIKSSPLKGKFLSFSSTRVKIRYIPYVNFETTSRFFIRFFIILQFHCKQILCKCLAHLFSTLGKRIPWKHQLWHFLVFQWKFSKFFMSFSKSQFSFSLNFSGFFSFVKDNPSVPFQVKSYILCTKGTSKSANFGDFRVLGSKFTEFLSFWQKIVFFFFKLRIILQYHET